MNNYGRSLFLKLLIRMMSLHCQALPLQYLRVGRRAAAAGRPAVRSRQVGGEIPRQQRRAPIARTCRSLDVNVVAAVRLATDDQRPATRETPPSGGRSIPTSTALRVETIRRTRRVKWRHNKIEQTLWNKPGLPTKPFIFYFSLRI